MTRKQPVILRLHCVFRPGGHQCSHIHHAILFRFANAVIKSDFIMEPLKPVSIDTQHITQRLLLSENKHHFCINIIRQSLSFTVLTVCQISCLNLALRHTAGVCCPGCAWGLAAPLRVWSEQMKAGDCGSLIDRSVRWWCPVCVLCSGDTGADLWCVRSGQISHFRLRRSQTEAHAIALFRDNSRFVCCAWVCLVWLKSHY